jgi:hypothetical protein
MNWSAVICQENSTTFQSLLWETSAPTHSNLLYSQSPKVQTSRPLTTSACFEA